MTMTHTYTKTKTQGMLYFSKAGVSRISSTIMPSKMEVASQHCDTWTDWADWTADNMTRLLQYDYHICD